MKYVFWMIAGLAAGFLATFAFEHETKATGAPLSAADQQQIRTVKTPDEMRSQLESLITRARKNPDDAATLRELKRDIGRWMRADPIECIRWLHERDALGLVDTSQFPELFASAFRGDLALAIREAMHIPDSRMRREWLVAVFKEAAELSPQRAFDLLEYLPANERDKMGVAAAQALAKKDPHAAWQTVLNSKSSWYQAGPYWYQSHYQWAEVVADTWAETNPGSFLAFVREKLNAKIDGSEVAFLAFGLQQVAYGENDKLMIDLLGRMPRNATLENLWISALGRIASRDPDEAIRIARSEPEGAQRTAALRQIAHVIGLNNLERGMSIVADVPSEAAKYEITKSILEVQASSSKNVAAAESADRIPNPVVRAQVMNSVARNWIRYGYKSFFEYVVTAPPPEKGPSWLDVTANIVKTGFFVEWISYLNDPVRERLAEEMRSRLSAEEWAKMEKSFLPRQKKPGQ